MDQCVRGTEEGRDVAVDVIGVVTGFVIGGAMANLWGISGFRKTSGETVTVNDWLPGGRG